MIILASNSPRRKELLSMLGYSFTVCPALCNEDCDCDKPSELVKILSKRKALAVEKGADDLVIGSDTVVSINNKILGKPENENNAAEMLKTLSDNVHTVYTGICVIYKDKVINETVSCDVKFKKLTDDEISNYISSGEPMDKAGAYGIQGKGAAFIEWINGDYYSVVGFPCCRINEILCLLGFNPLTNK